MAINFTQFDLKNPTNSDFLVGYKSDGSAEYRTTVSRLLSADGPSGIIYGRRDDQWVDITSPSNLQVRRGTAAEVAAITPLEGEPVWETDAKKLKVGDGVIAGGINVGNFPLEGTLRQFSVNPAIPDAGSVFIASEVDAKGGTFFGGPFVSPGNVRGKGAVDLQAERIEAEQVASGNYSFIAGSARSTASARNSVVLGSTNTICSGAQSVALGCLSKTLSGEKSLSFNSNISHNNCIAFNNGIADRRGVLVHGSDVDITNFDDTKRCQTIEFILKQRTTNNTPASLVIDAIENVSSLIEIPTNVAMFGTIDVCAIQETTGQQAVHYIRKFGIRNVNSTTELIENVTTIGTDYESSSGTDISITADNNLSTLYISVTGLNSTILRWVGVIRATEMSIA